MANKLSGEVELAAGGSTYLLRFTCGGLVGLHGTLDPGAEDAEFLTGLSRLDEAGMDDARLLHAVVYYCCRSDYDGARPTRERAGEIVELIGLVALARLAVEAIRLAMPEPPEPSNQTDAKAPEPFTWSNFERDALRTGLTSAAFRDSTPREIVAAFKAWTWREERRDEQAHRTALWGAWHAAALARQEKLPRLAPLLRKIGGTPRRTPAASPEEASRRWVEWALARGLKVTRPSAA